MNERPKQNTVVAVLADMPTTPLLCGQVGAVVELLLEDNVLVEFTDDCGCAYAIPPNRIEKLLVLRYEREVALGEWKWIANCHRRPEERNASRFLYFTNARNARRGDLCTPAC